MKVPPNSAIGVGPGSPDYSKIVVQAMAKSWPLGAATLDVGSWNRDEVEPSGKLKIPVWSLRKMCFGGRGDLKTATGSPKHRQQPGYLDIAKGEK